MIPTDWMDGMDNPQQKLNIKVQKIRPKFVAQVCPTCHGFGTLKFGSKICNGCEGKTWILVPAEEAKNGS